MAQKLILCECNIGSDLLEHSPLSGYIADGYEVKSASGYSARDNRHMSLVLLTSPEATVAAPSFALHSFSDSVSVEISSSTTGASIYYTTDGTTPTSDSTAYSAPITASTDTDYKAIAIKDGVESEVASFSYFAATADETED